MLRAVEAAVGAVGAPGAHRGSHHRPRAEGRDESQAEPRAPRTQLGPPPREDGAHRRSDPTQPTMVTVKAVTVQCDRGGTSGAAWYHHHHGQWPSPVPTSSGQPILARARQSLTAVEAAPTTPITAVRVARVGGWAVPRQGGRVHRHRRGVDAVGTELGEGLVDQRPGALGGVVLTPGILRSEASPIAGSEMRHAVELSASDRDRALLPWSGRPRVPADRSLDDDEVGPAPAGCGRPGPRGPSAGAAGAGRSSPRSSGWRRRGASSGRVERPVPHPRALTGQIGSSFSIG